MKIEKYVSGQYAGTLDQSISFQPGMNVILGDNETGKSTMISGIMNTLLMPAKLDKRSEKGKEFVLRVFPTNGTNFIDGEVQLTLGGERVVIKKEWDKDDPQESRTAIRYLDSGKRTTGATAEEEIKKLLGYGDAVYQKIIFGRQDNENEILDWFFSFLRDETDSGIAEAKNQVAGATAAAGGISEELFLAKLEDKLKTLSGHWDFDRDRPEKGRELGNRWLNGVGSILSAYYAWREKSEAYEKGEELIQKVSGADRRLCEQREERQRLTEEQDTLQKQKSAIQNADLLCQRKNSLEKDLQELLNDKKNWPKLLEERMQLDAIIAEDEERSRRKKKETLEETLRNVKKCDDKIADCQNVMKGKENIEADAEAYNKLQQELNGIKIKLSATKLIAKIALQSEYRADVESADGLIAQGIQIFSETVTGYTKITLPGIGEVTVVPQDVDVNGLKVEREKKLAKVQKILDRYDVKTREELEWAASTYRESKKTLGEQESEREHLLAGQTVGAVTAALQQIKTDPSLVIGENLDQRIQETLAGCQETSLDNHKAVVNQQLKDLETKYSSHDELEKRWAKTNKELKMAKDNLAQIGEIPMTQEDYDKAADDIAERMKKLDRDLENTIREHASLVIESDEIDLETLRLEQADLKKHFEHQKRLYQQYARIRKDFIRIQEGQESQYDEFYALFNRYLSVAAGSSLYIEEESTVVSKKNELPGKEFLSMGTKKTILLAFRLALLKYYYPDESGIVVLDDILLDMDPGRREGAAKLLSEFAKENQVIFTTCDPAIAELLGGYQIKI